SSKLNWVEFNASKRDHVTIEHIYPRSPAAADWPAFAAHPTNEQALLRHSLGNLLALSQSRNSRFSNRPFAAKKQDADGVRGYSNGSYSENAVAKFQDWTPQTVVKRGLDMLGFLEERWKVDLGSTTEKLSLLNLEFIS